jgi:BASS family bile acid:Na+ symporter
MNKIFQFIKNQALPIAIVTGSVFYDFFCKFAFILPVSMFVMLTLSFTKVSLKEIKFKKVHILLLAVIILGALGTYLAVAPFNKILAESMMVIIMCPTAVSAVVVTTKLGGNAANIVSFTILANIAAALIIPSVFPLIEAKGLSFWEGFLAIIQKVFPLLVFPMILAEFIKKFMKKTHDFMLKYSGVSFYIWAGSIMILMGRTVKSIVEQPENYHIDILMGIASLIICVVLFTAGKIIGTKFDERISCGQSIGQKNTIFSIWVAGTYLDPLSALGSGFYIVCQNLFNSWQLDKKRKADKEKNQKID